MRTYHVCFLVLSLMMLSPVSVAGYDQKFDSEGYLIEDDEVFGSLNKMAPSTILMWPFFSERTMLEVMRGHVKGLQEAGYKVLNLNRNNEYWAGIVARKNHFVFSVKCDTSSIGNGRQSYTPCSSVLTTTKNPESLKYKDFKEIKVEWNQVLLKTSVHRF